MSDKKDSPAGNTTLGDNAKGNAAFTGGVGQDFVQGNKIINEAPKSGLPALHQLEPPPPDFVGREAELAELLTLVKQGGVTISGLQGLGGVGKTTLALKLASLLKEHYPHAQFFLDLKGPEQQPLPATEALKFVIRAYHPTVTLPESLAELRPMYLSVLDGQQVLLLMDNARDERQIKPLLPPPGCLLLVTSRFHFTVPGLKVKSLDALPLADAIKLLLEIAPRIGDHASEIAKLCGNLPLGLRAAASFLSTRANYKVAEYVRKLRESSTRLEWIEAPLSLSYELLREEIQTNWRALSIFPDSFDQRAAAAVWQSDKDQTLELLGELLSFSLVEWSEETDRYRLHDLARVFADSRLTETERLTHQLRHAEHFLQVLTEANQLYKQGNEAIKTGVALFDREWSNAQAAWVWVKDYADATPRALELCNEYPDASANIAEIRQHPRERIAWREAALAAAQKLGRKEAQSAHLCDLGATYWSLGENQRAIEFYEQDLAITCEFGDRRGEGQTLNNLGLAYADLSEPRRAIEFYEQSLAITREFGDRRVEGYTLNNLGIAYKNLGETRRAIEFYEQDLAITRESGDRRGEGQTLNNLGCAYADLGETRRAIEFFEQRLAIAREVGDRRGEGHALWNTAVMMVNLGDRAQAIALAEAALVIRDQIEDPNAAMVRKALEEWRSEGGAANE